MFHTCEVSEHVLQGPEHREINVVHSAAPYARKRQPCRRSPSHRPDKLLWILTITYSASSKSRVTTSQDGENVFPSPSAISLVLLSGWLMQRCKIFKIVQFVNIACWRLSHPGALQRRNIGFGCVVTRLSRRHDDNRSDPCYCRWNVATAPIR